jgi:hypothetical protein
MLIFTLTPLKSSCTNEIYDCIVGTETLFVVTDVLCRGHKFFPMQSTLCEEKSQITFEIFSEYYLILVALCLLSTVSALVVLKFQ